MIASTLRRYAVSACIGALSVICAATVHAEPAWPAKPVTLVVPFPPGGDLDTVGRLLADGLAKRTGQSFVVENRAGAGGTIGAAYVAHAAADGYTLLLGSSGDQVNAAYLYAKLPYSPENDLSPISIVARGHLVLLASPAAPYADVAGLLGYAKAHPGEVTYASSGTGTASHLAGELLQQVAGLDMVHVPFKGNAPALSAVLGGHVQLIFASPVTASQHLRQRTLEPIAATTTQRSETRDGVMPFADAGLQIDVPTLYVLTAPKGVPAPIVEKLSREVSELVGSSDFAERLRALGASPQGDTPDEARQFLDRERTRWQAVITKAGITADQ